MTVITMNRTEIDRMGVLHDLADGRIKIAEASRLMGLGRRQVFRLAKAKLQLVPGFLRVSPFSEFIAPGGVVLRPAQLVGLGAVIDRRHRAVRPSQAALGRLVDRAEIFWMNLQKTGPGFGSDTVLPSPTMTSRASAAVSAIKAM
jgi:hypothetical protein